MLKRKGSHPQQKNTELSTTLPTPSISLLHYDKPGGAGSCWGRVSRSPGTRMRTRDPSAPPLDPSSSSDRCVTRPLPLTSAPCPRPSHTERCSDPPPNTTFGCCPMGGAPTLPPAAAKRKLPRIFLNKNGPKHTPSLPSKDLRPSRNHRRLRRSATEGPTNPFPLPVPLGRPVRRLAGFLRDRCPFYSGAERLVTVSGTPRAVAFRPWPSGGHSLAGQLGGGNQGLGAFL